jgi:hypothetical protein
MRTKTASIDGPYICSNWELAGEAFPQARGLRSKSHVQEQRFNAVVGDLYLPRNINKTKSTWQSSSDIRSVA